MAGTTTTTVCAMCGDVGFPDKLFRCSRCRYRIQHSYCTNYYGQEAPGEAGANVCDWCLSDAAAKASRSSSSATAAAARQQAGAGSCSQEPSAAKGKASGGEQESGRRATKAAGRRYKLLKDVLC